MYYIIYQTTNQINGKKYIGKHKTDNLYDNYLGSGSLLVKSIRKYGRENFKKDILFIFDNESDMNNKEIELITDDVLKNEEYYNIALGGQGGAIVMIPDHPLYESTCKKISDAQKLRSASMSEITKKNHELKVIGMYGKKQSDRQKQIVSEKMKGVPKSKKSIEKQKQSIRITLDDPSYIHPNTGRKANEETLKRMSDAVKNRPKKTCPHCGILMDLANYARYHGDNCKKRS